MKRVILKVRLGRGRKRETTVEVLQGDLLADSDRPRKVGVKFGLPKLHMLGKKKIGYRKSDVYSANKLDT